MVKRLLWLLALLGPAWARPEWVQVRGPHLCTQSGAPIRLRGINLGNWWVPEGYMFGFQKATSPTQLERLTAELLGPQAAAEFWIRYRESYVRQQDLRRLRECGFNAVRVPLHHKFLRAPAELARLDWLIAECARLDLWVLLDLHAAPAGQTGDNIDDGFSYPWFFESEADQQETARLWQELARRYRDEPTVLGYELLNEPIPDWNGYASLEPRLDPAYRRLGQAIRQVDSRHTLWIEGAKWGMDPSPLTTDWDPQLVLAFHCYWVEPGPARLHRYLELRRRSSIPLMLTESGENSDDWIEDFRKELDREQIGWFFWPYKKMKTTSCVALIPQPANWEQVVAYADSLGQPGKERHALRPAPEVARRAFADLLEAIRWERCQEQSGFLRALGLKDVTHR